MLDGSIIMTCFGCGAKLKAPGTARGEYRKCGSCGEIFKVFEDGMPERMVEVWFSQESQFARMTIDRVIHFIDCAKTSLDIAMYSLTHDWLHEPFARALARGVAIRILVDRQQAGCKGSDDKRYAAMGIAVARDVCAGLMHHKFAIRDRKCVLTGSYNWTKSAEGCHRENFLIIHYQHVVRQYAGEFERLWTRNAKGIIVPETTVS